MNTYLKLTVCFLLLVHVSTAQTVEVIDKKGTIKTIRNNQVTVAITEPNTPIEGDIWIDTTSSITKIYDGSNWYVINEPNNDSSVHTGSFKITGPGGASSTTISKAISNLPFLPSQITFVAHTNIQNLSENGSNEDGPNGNTINNTFGSMNGFVRSNANSTPSQQHVIFIGGNGSSINDISRYSSNSHCIGLRYTNNNGINLGIINASLASFDTNAANSYGFTLSVNYILGTDGTTAQNSKILLEDVMVLFTAYK